LTKKLWCCDKVSKGCEELPYDCNAGLSNYKAGWSVDKKAWCCQHRGKGCPGHGAAVPLVAAVP
jgi:hypothetical protein